MQVNDYLQFLTSCQSIDELWKSHCAMMEQYDFDRLIYGFTRYRTDRSLGDPQDFVILTNQTETYMRTFIGEGHYVHAPMVKWAVENEGACSWDRLARLLEERRLSREEERVLEFNKRMKVRAGYTVSFKSVTARSKGAIALTARDGMSQDEVNAMWRDHGADIQLMNNVAHLKIMTLPYENPGRALTPRQREALEWVGDGKTTQDIALLMGLRAATVEKHLRLARETLAVETTAQAVLKAAFANQMFILQA